MASIPTYTTVSAPLLQSLTFWLTESPVHDQRTGHLQLRTILPRPTEDIEEDQYVEYVGCIALIEGDERHLLLGAKRGVAKIDVETGKMEYLN
ncbi:hypothetical protein EV426DRAFT_698962 [Tirmania nivea]|nr:hypothetical protein EV426DRAFT_698962 [Tirmania nivea]